MSSDEYNELKAIADDPIPEISEAIANFDPSKPTHYHAVFCYNPVADQSLLLDHWVENPEYESNVLWYDEFIHEMGTEMHLDFKGIDLYQNVVGIYHAWGPLGYSKDWETGICDEVWVDAEVKVLSTMADTFWRGLRNKNNVV